MNPYQLLVDVWEADTLLDEAALVANGVAGCIIRLNDMNGGHHMDKNFTTQWIQTGNAGLLRAPYFVYNPWVDGATNYSWLMANLPAGVGRIFVDIEVTKLDYSPATYAFEVNKFLSLFGTKPVSIYTGAWFLSKLSSWPKTYSYWWAQYPFLLYPPMSVVTTWEHVREIVATLMQPSNAASCPGPIKLWQASGDRLILPGSAGKPVDVNIFSGTRDELAAWLAGTSITPSITAKFGWLKPRYPGVYGPAIIAGSDAPKANHPVVLLDAEGQQYIKNLNGTRGDEIFKKIFAPPDVGPTKGINDNGKLLLIMAGWSGNLVKIIGKSGDWTQIECISSSKPFPPISEKSHAKTPWLVHRMTTVNQFLQFIFYPIINGIVSVWDLTNVPLMSAGQFWIPSSWIVETFTTKYGLNIRSGPGTAYSIIGYLAQGVTTDINNIVVDASNNLWATKDGSRWFCIKFGTESYVTNKIF